MAGATMDGMYETAADVSELQGLLDASIAGSSAHLRSIVEPGRRTMTAERVISSCADVCVLNLATVTASGEPCLSAVDGHLLHGRWHFTTAASAVKARHLRARPGVSVAWTPADGLGVWTHGRVAFIEAGTQHWQRFDRHLVRAYDQSPSEWADFGEIVYLRVEPHWMVGLAMTDDELGEVDAARTRRQERLAAPLIDEEL